MRVFLQEQRSLKAGDLSHQESNNMAASTMKLQSDSFTSEKVSLFFHEVFVMKNVKNYEIFLSLLIEYFEIIVMMNHFAEKCEAQFSRLIFALLAIHQGNVC